MPIAGSHVGYSVRRNSHPKSFCLRLLRSVVAACSSRDFHVGFVVRTSANVLVDVVVRSSRRTLVEFFATRWRDQRAHVGVYNEQYCWRSPACTLPMGIDP